MCGKSLSFGEVSRDTIAPGADMSGVAKWAPQAFALVLASTPTGRSGTVRWIPSPPGTFELVYGSSSQYKWETYWCSCGHGGHICNRSISSLRHGMKRPLRKDFSCSCVQILCIYVSNVKKKLQKYIKNPWKFLEGMEKSYNYPNYVMRIIFYTVMSLPIS